MSIVKVTRNYQVTIPRDVRDDLHIKLGDTLHFSSDGERMVVQRKTSEEIIRSLCGGWKDRIGKSTSAHLQGIRKGWRRKTW